MWSQLPNYYFDPLTDPAVPSSGKQKLLICPKGSSGMNLTDPYLICELPSFSKVLFTLFHFILVRVLFSLWKSLLAMPCFVPSWTLADTN